MRTGTSRSSRVAATLTTRHHGPLLVFISLASKVADVETHSTAFCCQSLHSFTPTRTIICTSESSSPIPRRPFRDMPLPSLVQPSDLYSVNFKTNWNLRNAIQADLCISLVSMDSRYSIIILQSRSCCFFFFFPINESTKHSPKSITPSNSSTLFAKLAGTQHTRS